MKECKICGKKFKNLISLGNHIHRVHKGMNTKKYYDKFLKKDDEGICKMYGKISTCKKNTRFLSLNSGYSKFCDVKCMANCKQTRDKYKSTCLKKYNKDNFAKTKEFLKKSIATFQKHYQFSNPSKHPDVKEKVKNTNLRKRGVPSSFLDPEVKEKIKNSNIKIRNVENAMESIDTQLKCRDTYTKNFIPKIQEFISNRKISFSNEKYVNAVTKRKWICLKCNHEFETTWFQIQQGKRCPKCYPPKIHRSSGEIDLSNYFKTLDLIIIENDRSILRNEKNALKSKELDIFFPELKIAIEFNGIYFHSNKRNCPKNYHLNKTLKCNEKGIHLIHIFEDEWKYYKENFKIILKKIIVDGWDLLPKNEFESITLNRRFCKSLEYYEKLGFNIEIIKPRLYHNKNNFKVWDCGFLTLNYIY